MARANQIYADEGIAIAALDNTTLTVLAVEITMPRLRALRRYLEGHTARHGDRTASLTVIEPPAMSASPDAREESADLTRRYPAVASATVIEGTGFKAVAARAALSGIFLLARKTGHKLFSSATEGSAWIVQELAKAQVRGPSAAEILAAVEETRRAIKR